MTAFKCLVVLLFIASLNISSSLRNFDIHLRSVNCSIVKKSYLGFFNCSLNEWPRNRGNYVSADVQFSRDIKNLILDFAVFLPGQSKNSQVKFRADGCQWHNLRIINPMITAVMKQILHNSNFPDKCPLKANVNYSIRGLAINPDYFPGNTPEMRFFMNISISTDRIQILAIKLEANIEKKKSRKG